MKKWTYIFFTLIGLLALSGCSGLGESKGDESKFQESVRALWSDEKLSKYLLKVNFEKPSKDEYFSNLYIVSGKIDDSFDKLSKKEQYDFFAYAIDVIRGVNKENDGYIDCERDKPCEISYISFSTSTQDYNMMYTQNGEKGSLSLGYGINAKEYNSDGSLTSTPLVNESASSPNPDINSSNSRTEEATNDSIPDINISTSDGNDWMEMSSVQKHEIVSTALSNLKSKEYTILEDADWFVEALDAFYGDTSTNGTKVTEAIAMTGVGGKIIIKP
ncbi:hypothetical protein [Bacillus cereus]|uniref:hypothetical protein n=1 Tax=Bacillus cereus TaxID=1396 RepID=UPI0003302E0C|nr:hypothetical protein [Bacillus cereus]EOP12914.1 hypothetical protein II1_03296 [Bacillus cereus MC118]